MVVLSFSKAVSEANEDGGKTVVLLISAILYIPLEQQQPPRMRFDTKFRRSLFQASFNCSHGNGTKRLRTVPQIASLFFGPLFGTKVLHLTCSRVNVTNERSTFRNKTTWNSMYSFPCKRGLRVFGTRLCLGLKD